MRKRWDRTVVLFRERSERLLRRRRAASSARARCFFLASEASLCCIGQLTRTAPETHGQLRRTVPEWGPKSYAPVKPDNVQMQIRFWFFFWPKEGRKKRENNSIVNTKKNVSPGGVGFFWSGQFWLFLLKKRVFFNLLPTARARARIEVGNEKKTDFFWELKKLFTGTPVAF